MIQINNLSKQFRTKDGMLTVLDQVHFQVDDGDIFGVIGMSGAGKSTLIRCINMLEKPTSGSVEINGIDITTRKHRELNQMRKDIGMIFQGFNLLMQKNVARNVAFGLEIIPVSQYIPTTISLKEYMKLSYWNKRKAKKEDIKARVRALLEEVELTDKADYYPAQLSGGQKQRVAIARALATNPGILLCDEATSALDTMTTNSILNLLKKINKERGVTIIIITHEMEVIEKICNRVVVIDQAKIVEMGDAEDVLAKPNSIAAKKLMGGLG